jgi:IMP dehydrogenase
MELGLTFNDVLLEPRWSSITSRYENKLDTSGKFSRNIKLKLPIASANMRTVTDAKMCCAMAEAGGIGILHRNFITTEDWLKEIDDMPHGDNWGLSLGVQQIENMLKNPTLDLIPTLYKLRRLPKVIVIDVANAANERVFKLVQKYLAHLDNASPGCRIDVVVGNIATADAAARYKELDIDGIKVGIGPGAACTTRIMTGCGVPQLTAIMEVARVMRHSDIAIIADGGVQQPGHFGIALAAGADCVMMGKKLAYAIESPGWHDLSPESEFTPSKPQFAKTYQGEASFSNDRTHEGVKQNILLEVGDFPKTVKEILAEYEGGLRSTMAYNNSLTIKHLQENHKFVRVTTNTLIENGARH